MSPKYILTALTALTITACADAGESMIILRNQEPGDGCTVSATATGTFITSGRIHPDSTIGYIFTPVVMSLVVERDGSDRLIFVEGADVEIEDATGGAIAAYGVPFSGNIAPEGTTSFGFELLPPEIIDMVGETLVVANVQIYGSLAGGEVKSDVFRYPIDICSGCFEVNLGPCSSLEPGYVGEVAGSTCNLLQDGAAECCESASGELTCPAIGPPEA